MYVTVVNNGSINGSVSIIDMGKEKVERNITVGINPRAIQIDENNIKAYVANSGSNSVSVINITDKNISNWKRVIYYLFPTPKNTY